MSIKKKRSFSEKESFSEFILAQGLKRRIESLLLNNVRQELLQKSRRQGTSTSAL